MTTEETIDRVFDGRVAVVQGRDGYRFSLDSLLLARFVEAQGRERIVDLGAGNGVVALSLAALNDGVEVLGVELQETMVERARRGVALNALRRAGAHGGGATCARSTTVRLTRSWCPRASTRRCATLPIVRPEAGG